VTATNTTQIFLDGVPKQMTVSGTDTGNFTQFFWDKFHIGDFADSGTTESNFTNGKIDDVRIYNRALTPVEVKQLYNLGTTKIVQ
jgi:hypothetical protein